MQQVASARSSLTVFLRIFCTLGILTTTLGCSSTSSKRQQAELHLQIGTGYLKSQNIPFAISELSTALELDPENPVAHNNFALALYVKGRLPEAETSLKKALQIRPAYSDAKNNLGRIYLDLGRYDDAIQLITQVIDDLKYTEPEKAYFNLGMAHFGKNDYSSAKTSFLNALKAKPAYCPAQAQYGISLFHLKQYRLATQVFDRLLSDCDRSFDEAHYFSALSFFQMGRKEDAKARLEEVIRIYPDSKFVAKSRDLLKAMN